MAMFRHLWLRFWFLAGGVNLQVKIMGIILLIVLTMGFSFAWFTWRNMASSLEREIEMRGIAIGNSLATNDANFILTDDMFEVYRLVRNALKTDDIRYIYMEDAEGLVLVHTFSAGFPTDLLDVNQLKGDATVVVPLDTGEEQLIDVSVPVLQGEGGRVHVGLSTASVSAAISDHARFILVAITAVLVPGLFTAYLLATIITRALGAVVKAADAVGQGDYAQGAPIWAKDG